MKKRLLAGLLLCTMLCTACGQTAENTPTSDSVKEETKPTAEETAIDRQIQNMSLAEKVGQLFWVRCPAQDGAQAAADYQFGGYVLFARDFEGQTPESVSENIQAYQEQAKIPMLIGVDEEGGTVNRISRYPAFRDEPFASPRKLYQQGGWDAIRQDTQEKCQLLSGLGVNVNLAPVCDVCDDPSGFLYPRSFGGDGKETAKYVQMVVTEMQGSGVAPVLKHFPGYGNNGDTHTEIIRDDRSYETYQNSDFLPFEAGIKAGAGCILVSHTIVSCMDAQRPASLSADVHQILREELGFSGVIMTDDLSMGAITQYCDGQEAAVQAVLADNDLLCCTDYETQIPAVIQAVQDGVISESRIEESVKRILQWKQDMGIL